MPLIPIKPAAPTMNVVLRPPAPIPQPPIASYAILRAVLDLEAGSETLVVVALDANGVHLGAPLFLAVPPPNAATTIAQVTPQLYADLQTALGISGTVA